MFPKSHVGLSTPLPNRFLSTFFLALRVAVFILSPCPGAAVSPYDPGTNAPAFQEHRWHGTCSAGSTRGPPGTRSPETLPGPTCNGKGGRQGRGLWRRTRPSGPRETRTWVLVAPQSRREAGCHDSLCSGRGALCLPSGRDGEEQLEVSFCRTDAPSQGLE